MSTCVSAEENSESSDEAPQNELQDMSDPLAVYTRLGAGLTNLRVNLKAGIDYDTGKDSTTAMHVFEIKGALGDALGWGWLGLWERLNFNPRSRCSLSNIAKNECPLFWQLE